MRRLFLLLAVAAAAVVAAKVALLSLSGSSHEPVGRLTPLAGVISPSTASQPAKPGQRTTPVPRQTGEGEGEGGDD